MRLGIVLRKWRISEELTLDDISAETGVPIATLQRVEKGSKMDGATLTKILNWLFMEQS